MVPVTNMRYGEEKKKCWQYHKIFSLVLHSIECVIFWILEYSVQLERRTRGRIQILWGENFPNWVFRSFCRDRLGGVKCPNCFFGWRSYQISLSFDCIHIPPEHKIFAPLPSKVWPYYWKCIWQKLFLGGGRIFCLILKSKGLVRIAKRPFL